jgi:hypothetical protein
MTSLAADAVYANKFCETVTQNILGGHQYSAAERKDIDVLMSSRGDGIPIPESERGEGQAPKALSIKLRTFGSGLLSSWVGVMRSSSAS